MATLSKTVLGYLKIIEMVSGDSTGVPLCVIDMKTGWSKGNPSLTPLYNLLLVKRVKEGKVSLCVGINKLRKFAKLSRANKLEVYRMFNKLSSPIYRPKHWLGGLTDDGNLRSSLVIYHPQMVDLMDRLGVYPDGVDPDVELASLGIIPSKNKIKPESMNVCQDQSMSLLDLATPFVKKAGGLPTAIEFLSKLQQVQ